MPKKAKRAVMPCPYCGSTAGINDTAYGIFWAACLLPGCGATGPEKHSALEAALAWDALSMLAQTAARKRKKAR